MVRVLGYIYVRTSPVGMRSLISDDGSQVKGLREHVGLSTRITDEPVHTHTQKQKETCTQSLQKETCTQSLQKASALKKALPHTVLQATFTRKGILRANREKPGTVCNSTFPQIANVLFL